MNQKETRVKITPLYRAKLTCQVGRDFLDKKKSRSLLPDVNSSLEQAMFSLLHAIEDIALALEQTDEKLQLIEGIVKKSRHHQREPTVTQQKEIHYDSTV